MIKSISFLEDDESRRLLDNIARLQGVKKWSFTDVVRDALRLYVDREFRLLERQWTFEDVFSSGNENSSSGNKIQAQVSSGEKESMSTLKSDLLNYETYLINNEIVSGSKDPFALRLVWIDQRRKHLAGMLKIIERKLENPSGIHVDYIQRMSAEKMQIEIEDRTLSTEAEEITRIRKLSEVPGGLESLV